MTIEDRVRSLPPQLRQEVSAFIDSLLARRTSRAGQRLRQDWAGAIREHRDRFTSMELQRKSLDWWGS